jgi:hypothetical protein
MRSVIILMSRLDILRLIGVLGKESMGVTYKLKDEVVRFIISQRESNPFSSCRQLAESASEKFGLHLSKSSVHDVLKESGVITPRGRKPKDKFQIPQERKKQIQVSLSQVKLLPSPVETVAIQPKQEEPAILLPAKPIIMNNDKLPQEKPVLPEKNDIETTLEYEGAGKVFLKAALWDLGIFSEENIRDLDWQYYLTYAKGIKVLLENDKSFFIEMPLPIERCIREVADGLINNVRPFMVDKISDQELFKVSMEAQEGFKISKISIVDEKDHILFEIGNIMECKRTFTALNREFVENNESMPTKRAVALFFPQTIDINTFINDILNLNGFDTIGKHELVINLLINEDDGNKVVLQQAADKLNGMCLYDEQARLVKVKI